MTKQDIKQLLGQPVKESKYQLTYPNNLLCYFKYNKELYLAVIYEADEFDNEPIVLFFDESVGNLDFTLATVL